MTKGFGHETRKGFDFVYDLMCYMIEHGKHTYRFPAKDQVIDLTHVPIEIARFEKIFKVLDAYSESKAGQRIKYFHVDDESGRRHLFAYQPVDDGASIRVTRIEVDR